MGIAPIPNLIPMRVSAPSTASPDVPNTQAIDFRRQQQEQDDATYTPSNREDENEEPEEGQPTASEALQASSSFAPDDPEDPSQQPTISVFA